MFNVRNYFFRKKTIFEILNNIFYIFDFFLIPLMLIARFFGLKVFEVKARAFGHSIEEPYVLSLFYEGINKNKKFLLFNSKKSFNKLAINLFSKNFKIIENYSYFSPFYWMSEVQ